MLPIPGTGKVKHLEENVAAANALSDEEFAHSMLRQEGGEGGLMFCATASHLERMVFVRYRFAT